MSRHFASGTVQVRSGILPSFYDPKRGQRSRMRGMRERDAEGGGYLVPAAGTATHCRVRADSRTASVT